MSGQTTAMASRRSGSPCAGNARKKKAYKAHFNPDWVKEWLPLIAKSNKGDTDAFFAFVVATLAFLRVSQNVGETGYGCHTFYITDVFRNIVIIADIRLLLCLNIVSWAHIIMQFVIFTS